MSRGPNLKTKTMSVISSDVGKQFSQDRGRGSIDEVEAAENQAKARQRQGSQKTMLN